MILLLLVASVAILSARGAGVLLAFLWNRQSRVDGVHPWALAAPAVAIALPVAGLLAGLGSLVPAVPWTWLMGVCACQAHPGVHLCPLHPPAQWSLVWPVLAGAGGLIASSVARTAAVAVRLRDVANLDLLAQQFADGIWHFDDGGRPAVFVGGLRHPKILAERAWWSGLPARDRAVITAHERAHLRGGDLHTAAWMDLLLAAFAPAAHRAIIADWRIAAEIRADAAAAREDGDPLFVAEVICRYARAAAPRGTAALGGGALTARIGALLEGPPAIRTHAVAVWVIAAAVATVFGHVAHRGIEALF